MPKLIKKIGFFIYLVLIVFLCFEIFFSLFFAHPAWISKLPVPILRIFHQIYFVERDLIQWNPGCAQYDPGLAYTLKPGECRFESREFSNLYQINRQGVRDTEDALQAPDVIVLGDSYAMGWGVDQEKAFPQRLAQKTGLKVLNAAVASYGTVREMKLLSRLDTSKLKTLIIQYQKNDRHENETFLNGKGILPIMSVEDYQSQVEKNRQEKRKYFGHYTVDLFKSVFEDRTKFGTFLARDLRSEAKAFLRAVLRASSADLSSVQLIVIDAERYETKSRFLEALQEEINEGAYPEFIKRLKCLDILEPLHDGDSFFSLDDHYNEKGHELISDLLSKAIKVS